MEYHYSNPKIEALYARVSPATRAQFETLSVSLRKGEISEAESEQLAHVVMADWCQEQIRRIEMVEQVLDRRISLMKDSGDDDPFARYEAETKKKWPPTVKDLTARKSEIIRLAREAARRMFGVKIR